MCRLVDPRRPGRIAACLLVIFWTAACAGPPTEAVLTADMPLHLEEHLDAATIVGSEVPEDLLEPVEWRFDEPQPDWQPVETMNPNTKPVKVERTDDALRLMLDESNHGRGGGNPRGGIVIDLPQWNGWDWGTILVRARSSEGIQSVNVGLNTRLGEPGASRGPNPYEFSGQGADAINDGTVQTYLLRVRAQARTDTWDRLGLWVGADEPATFEVLSVSVVRTEAAYTGASSGLRTADEVSVPALYVRAPGRVEYDVLVPESGRLDVALGVLRDDVPVVFRVRVVPEGGAPDTLLDEPWRMQQRWARRSVDLSRFAGQTVRLVLEADAERTGTVALFGSPTLYTPGRLSVAIADGSEPNQSPQVPWPTGEVDVMSGSVPCDGEGCQIQVTCANVAAPARAIVKVGMPTEPPARGTILLVTGGDGTQLYERQSRESRRIVDELRAAGFDTVQLQWLDSWGFASPGEEAGFARLGCRPATVARWVHDTIHQQLPGSAYCALGNSGGSMQIGYMLTHYGLEELLDTVVPSSGPPTSRIDLSCLRDDPVNEVMWFVDRTDWLTDAGFGYSRDGSGPCARGDTSFRDSFREASVASGDGDYSYPRTLVWFLFGEYDEPGIKRGMTYHDLLIENGSPLVHLDVLPDLPHALQRTPKGAEKILEILVNECRPRHE